MTSLLRLRIPFLLVGVIAGAGCAAALALHVERAIFFRAYLFSYLFCLGLSLGSLCLLLLHNLTGGEWGDQIRPFLRAGARIMPLLALLFLPLCLGVRELYPWARPEEVAGEPLLAHRLAYLNEPFFFVRAAIYFALWIALGLTAARQKPLPRGLSAAGLIVYLLTMTHAGIDWVMSREIDFYSTAFGFVITVGQTLSAMALATVLLPNLPPLRLAKQSSSQSRSVFNDLGNVMLTLVILWIYVSFMEFLVIWMGNSREDNGWYLQRGLSGNAEWHAAMGWRIVGIAILVFHFFVPFYLLLFRKVKRNRITLPLVAGVLLAAHALEQYWLVAPAGHGVAPRFDAHWVDAATLVGLVGIWFAVFLTVLRHIPLTPPALATPAEGKVAYE